MLPNTTDPRIRLLNRLYARKRKELQERKALREPGASADAEAPAEHRSVAELLSFIDGDAKKVPTKKKKKSKAKAGAKPASNPPPVDQFPETGFDDDDGDLELTPEERQQLDAEVAAFAERLAATSIA